VELFILSASNGQVETEKGNIVTNQEDRNVMKTLMMVIGALTAFFIFSIMAARMVSAGADKAADPMVESATIDRIKPFGEVNIGKAPVMKASSGVDGKGTYQSACFACHGTGAAGAPKLGDKGAWKKRIAQGNATLFDHAINGFKGMPAKGGNASLSDAAVKAAVEYMVKGSK
jgi:cytochrome c5